MFTNFKKALEDNSIKSILVNLISSKKLESIIFERLTKKEMEHLINLSIKLRISSLLKFNLEPLIKEKIIVNSQIKKLNRASSLQSANSIIILREAINLFRVLSKKNIDFIPLKGIHLISKYYKNASIRSIRDIDVLIPLNQIDYAVNELVNNGYYFKSGNYKKNTTNQESFQTKNYCIEPIYSPSGICIEIHHRISTENPCHFVGEFFKNNSKFSFGNKEIKALSNENLFLHIIYHSSSKQGLDVGLQALMDLKQILEKDDLNYDELLRLSILYKLRPNLEIFSIIFQKYLNCDKLVKNIEHAYYFDDEFIDKFITLMIFNSSSRASILLFRNRIKENFVRGLSLKNLVDETFSKKSYFDYIILFLKRFLRHAYTYTPILFKYIFIKQYREDNKNVIYIMDKIKDFSEK